MLLHSHLTFHGDADIYLLTVPTLHQRQHSIGLYFGATTTTTRQLAGGSYRLPRPWSRPLGPAASTPRCGPCSCACRHVKDASVVAMQYRGGEPFYGADETESCLAESRLVILVRRELHHHLAVATPDITPTPIACGCISFVAVQPSLPGHLVPIVRVCGANVMRGAAQPLTSSQDYSDRKVMRMRIRSRAGSGSLLLLQKSGRGIKEKDCRIAARPRCNN